MIMTNTVSEGLLDVVKYLDPRLDSYTKKAERIGLYSPYSIQENQRIEWYKSLGSLQYKTVALAGKPADTCIGGLCIVYSGDLSELMKGSLPDGTKIDDIKKLKEFLDKLPRLDQIVESIGPTTAKTYMVVYEDSLFANLLSNRLGFDRKLLEQILKEVSIRSSELIKKWITLTSGNSSVIDVYTSDIEEAIKTYLSQLAKENGSVLDRESNKVDLMYTYLWPKLLRNLGYIDTEDVVCSEPVQHFIETFSQQSGIQGFLKTNPWGKGKNTNFSVAGFLPSPSLNGNGNSRQDNIYATFTANTRRTQIIKIVKEACTNPFPLSQNPIVKVGYSYLYFLGSVRDSITELCELEKEYKTRKSGEINPINKICNTQQSRNLYGSRAIDIIQDVSGEFDALLEELFR